MFIPILHQDSDLIVVDKPIGVPTHAADAGDPYPADALRAVQAQTGLAYLGMHQRLDAETSGALLLAARREANAALAAAFAGRMARKVYLALTHGAPPRTEGVIDAAIVRDRGERYRVAAAADPRGQPARTRYRTLATRRGRAGLAEEAAFTLLEVIPETGRTHQIRVHLAHIGCPVVGDALYGPREVLLPRLCLHAWQLILPHPATGQPITFTAPPPEVMGDLKPGSDDFPGLAGRRPGRGSPLLRLAAARRAPLAADPQTNIYRLVNAAADGLPGLMVDRYGDALVAGVYTDDDRWPPAPLSPALGAALLDLTAARALYVRYRPRQASRLSTEQLAVLAPEQPVMGAHQPQLVAREDGLAYLIRPGEGLNAGLFPDMREGRGRVRAWAAGRRVLNCFAYTCGFGVAASAGGATRVLNLDLSKNALTWGQENYRLNGLTPDPHDFVFGDVFDWLARLARRGERFDLVILDPPGFSRAKSRTFSAAHDYAGLVELAARVLAADGLLLACCNVAELPWRAFRERALAGVAAAGRPAAVQGVYHEPALDFPVAPGSEPYLKLLAVKIG
jgi:23S rRNA (cytosine1962-C5)-methyltransferase